MDASKSSDDRAPPASRRSRSRGKRAEARPAQLTLRQIQCLATLAETLHFGRGAERLNMTQPAFSRQIKTLEEALGLHLVERSKQRVSLTPAGVAFVEGSADARKTLENAVARARLIEGGFAGRLALGYTDFAISGVLPNLLSAFKQAFPDLILEPTQGCTQELLAALRAARLDIAFVTGPIVEEAFDSRLISEHRLLAVLYESHPLVAKSSIRLQDLADEPFVFGLPKLWRHYLRHVDELFTTARIRPNVVETAFNSEGLFGLVACKLGVTLYPDCALNYHRTGLVLREVEDLSTVVPTVAVWRRAERSKALQHMHGVLDEVLEAAHAGPGATREDATAPETALTERLVALPED